MFNLSNLSQAAGCAVDFAQTISGVKHLKAGIRDITKGNYRQGLKNLAIGTLPTLIVTTTVLLAMYNPLQNRVTPFNPNDLCQSANTTLTDLCKGNLGIPRDQMPQVNRSVLDAFLTQRHPEAVSIAIPARDLIPIQREMNLKTVLGILSADEAGKFNPCSNEILVTQNLQNQIYVVDGHHRYAACALREGVQRAIKVVSEALPLLSELNNFPGVTREGL